MKQKNEKIKQENMRQTKNIPPNVEQSNNEKEKLNTDFLNENEMKYISGGIDKGTFYYPA